MSNFDKSKNLNNKIETQISPEVKERLEYLKWLGIDPELFILFEKKINDILTKNPWSEDVISSELGKTWLSIEASVENYDRQFRSILKNSWNDESYNQAA